MAKKNVKKAKKQKTTNDLLGFLEKIDFRVLRSQKALLVELASKADEAEADAIDGIIGLLDSMQDDAAALGMEAAFGKSSNENCLVGIKCPDCGNEDYFHIAVLSFTDVTDDGTGSNSSDTEWDAMSAIECGKCHLLGRVWQFQA